MFVPNGLARAAVRFKPAAFVGRFVALAMAALIVSACGILLETGLRVSVPPVLPQSQLRSTGGTPIADVPVVAAADQRAHLVTGHGEDREDDAVPLPDKAWLDNSLVEKAGSVAGARAAVPDVTFPVQTREGEQVTAHGWGSTAFTVERLTSGQAPGEGEVVLTKGVFANGVAQGAVGDRGTLTTADGPRTFRVSGLTKAEAPTAWFTDTEAVRVSGHPGRVDAIAVLPKEGVSAGTLKSQVEHALGNRAEVYAGDDRGTVEDSSLAEAKALLVALAGIALGTAIAPATLVPMMKGLTGQAPYIPPLVYGSFAAAMVILGLTAATVPARAAIRGTLDA
ncbi:hypothetical protein [Streptomyces sp. NBC_00878]|uniref:hypothetical protein n=1 Tax=Streptomyces sp. NBC_00878 TaxID=2975854 RepID=UPI00225A4135|nr:hypothetical protein [Streptomyces sp. NBC_00878]MCX4908688.1 hypothetical protein [Streptomyces sp. NBC_00878]